MSVCHVVRSHDLDEQGTELCDEVQRALRRKLTETDLKDLLDRLEHLLDSCTQTTRCISEADEMSGSDGQTERHIQRKERLNSDSEPRTNSTKPRTDQIALKDTKQDPRDIGLTLQDVINRCPGFQCFFPEPVRSWRQLDDIASRLAPMMGIERPVFAEARHRMGCAKAIVAVLYIHERLSDIKSPGAYLRRLSQSASSSGFDVISMLSAGR